MVQGVRPAGLQKVPTLELAEFINVCIGPREGRPRARQLLKHPFFDTIRQEKCAQYKMQAENGLMATGSGIPFSGRTSPKFLCWAHCWSCCTCAYTLTQITSFYCSDMSDSVSGHC